MSRVRDLLLMESLGGLPPSPEEIARMMAEADADGDGFISLSEFVERRRRRPPEGPSRPPRRPSAEEGPPRSGTPSIVFCLIERARSLAELFLRRSEEADAKRIRPTMGLLARHKLRIVVSLLALIGCTTSTLSMPIFSGLSNLTCLSLKKNSAITAEGMKVFSNLGNLVNLDLERCAGIHGGLIYLKNVVIIVAVIILVGLFILQHYGTDKVGWLFAPIVLLWFIFIGVIGFLNILKYERSVLKACSPVYIIRYFKRERESWTSLGGILLSITGTEALFADLSHFPVPAIQVKAVGDNMVNVLFLQVLPHCLRSQC